MQNLDGDIRSKFNLMIESSGFGTWEYNFSTEVLSWDEGMFRLYGITPEEFTGKNTDWRKRVFPEDLERIENELAQAFNGSSKMNSWFRIIKNETEIVRLRCDCHIERNEEGILSRVVGINRDITEEHRSLLLLTEQKALLSSIVDNIPVAIFMKDLNDDLKFTIWNKAAEKLWGLKTNEIIGKNDYDFFPKNESDLFREKDMQVILSGKPEIIDEETITLANKEVHYLRTQKVPINGRFLLGVSEDITVQKESQLKLIESSKMSSLGEMAGNIAHEINGPLAIIHGRVDQLKKKINLGEIDTQRILEDLGKIRKTSERISKIVKGLRFFSRNADDDPMHRVNITQIVEDTLELCLDKFKGHKVSLSTDYPSDLELFCQPTQVSQVLLNLLSNALDAAVDTTEKWVHLAVSTEEDFIKITVTDSGRGISPEVQAKIMDPFFTTKEIGKGTGLGLSISQGIIALHKGELYYDRQCENTTFVILLPQK